MTEETSRTVAIAEQETVVQFNRTDDFMTIFTSDRTTMTKLDKHPEIYEVIEEGKFSGNVVTKTYRASKKMLTFRGKIPVKRELTEEERKILSERARLNFNS